MNSDVLRRFRKPTKSSGSSTEQSKATGAVFWPKDLLPEDCPECRILTWGYDSHVSRFLGGPANQNSFFDHAKNLLYAIDRERTHCVSLVVFMTHPDCYDCDLPLIVCLSAGARNHIRCAFFRRYMSTPYSPFGSHENVLDATTPLIRRAVPSNFMTATDTCEQE